MKILVCSKQVVSLVLSVLLIASGVYFGSQAYYSDYPKVEVADDAEHPLLISQNSSVQTLKFSPMRKASGSSPCDPCPELPSNLQGTLSRRDNVPPSSKHWPCEADHTHSWWYKYNQNPTTCACFLTKIDEDVECH